MRRNGRARTRRTRLGVCQKHDLPIKQVITPADGSRSISTRLPTRSTAPSLTPAITTAWTSTRLSMRSQITSRAQGAGGEPSIIGCATGACRDSATGARRSDHLLRRLRCRAGSRRGPARRTARERRIYRARFAAQGYAGVRQCQLSRMRQGRAARDRYVRHLR